MKGAARTANAFGTKIKLIDVCLLKPHEKTNKSRLKKILVSVKKKGLLFPVIIEKTNYIILDGHHRAKVFELLGIKKILCVLVDYSSEKIKLFQRRKINVSKKLVVERAVSGNLFPFKTTKHVLELFRINHKLGGNEMQKIIEIKKTGGNKMKKELTEIKTKNFSEGSCLWRNKFTC